MEGMYVALHTAVIFNARNMFEKSTSYHQKPTSHAFAQQMCK